MALKRFFLPALLGAALLIGTPASSSAAAEGEAATAEGLFARVETLYRQLDQVDPRCSDRAAWGAVALAFSDVVERFPGSPLAGDALWRVGDIHSRQLASGLEAAGEPARQAYRALVDRYPSSSFAPASYLRLAELGSPDESETYYYRILQQYPASEAATEARHRLTRQDAVPATEQPVAAPAARADSQPNIAPAVEPALESPSPEPTAAVKPLGEVLEAEPTPASGASASLAAPLPPEALTVGRVLGVRHFSDRTHTRVVFDLDHQMQFEIGEAKAPPRLYVDLVGAELDSSLPKAVDVSGTGVRQVRLAVNRPGVVRIVLDLQSDAHYSFFTLENPARLVVDVPSPELSAELDSARRPDVPEGGSMARQLALGVRRIVIDPGHGGSAPGAIGRSGITEKELTLDISTRLADNLRRSRYEVILTREGDRTLDLEARPRLATAAEADLFVSVHINSANNRKLSGFETYYLDLATDPTAAETAARENAQGAGGVGNLDHLLDEIVKNANKRESRDLAQSIQDSLVLQTNKGYDGVRDLGVKHAPFIVLTGASMPAVLVECSFLSNAGEEERLQDPAYRQQIADAIHIGIENYIAKRRMLTASQ